MARTINPLLDLAWSMLPERAIVARVTNGIVRKGLRWAHGYQGDVKRMVKDSRPPRGEYVPRLNAVIDSLDAQREIRRERGRHGGPIDWSKYEQPDRRTRRGKAFRRYTNGQIYGVTCNLIRRIGNTRVLVGSTGYRNSLLVLLQNGVQTKFKISNSEQSLAQILLQDFDTKLLPNDRRAVVEQAIEQGAAISFDFQAYTTTVRYKDGREHVIDWRESGRLRKE